MVLVVAGLLLLVCHVKFPLHVLTPPCAVCLVPAFIGAMSQRFDALMRLYLPELSEAASRSTWRMPEISTSLQC